MRIDLAGKSFDKINVILSGVVTLISLIVYYLTVAPTYSFWDCGEFIASSYILGIPHPPGSPLFLVLGRIFAIIPFAADICYRINLLSVFSSAAAVLFGYLSLVRIIKHCYKKEEFSGWAPIITFVGAIAGALFMAFSSTYWGNAVEAEVYGLSMMLMTMILWLALRFIDTNNDASRSKIVILVSFLAMMGVAVHLSTFLILPVVAIFFVLKKDAPRNAYIFLSLFFVAELLGIVLFADGRGGYAAFIFASVLLILGLAFLVYKYINWPILIAIGSYSMIMTGYYQFVYGVIGGLILLVIMSRMAPHTDWKTGLVIIIVAVIGFSFHLFIPIRSGLHPRIDENNTSRGFSLMGLVSPSHRNAFINFLERKQYGSQSMVDRMFDRRGTMAHQFGRHAHMGFWSFFEDQYGLSSIFGLIFLLGLFGLYFVIDKKIEVGLPILILLLLGTVGLVLYMNFADGVMYNSQSGDAYLEVRNRDYFFTPGYAYFGLVLGLGIAALMELARRKTLSGALTAYQKPILAVLSLLVLSPVFALSGNYHINDRHDNYLPKIYSENMLDTCEKDAILFTSGDNDTFPLWCIQEVYNYRKDVRVVNLSLFNTDWYIYQMKWQYGVPLSLTQEQIEWNDYSISGQTIKRPTKPFVDRARKKRTYLIPLFDPDQGRNVKLQDMMVDEVVIENKCRYPIYFSSEPYEESPLKLIDSVITSGLLYKMDPLASRRKIDSETGYQMYKNVYKFDGLNDPELYRDENATGVMLGLGFNAVRIADDFYRSGDTARAKEILEFAIDRYPECLQAHTLLAHYVLAEGDSLKAEAILDKCEVILKDLIDRDPESMFYLSDYGLLLHERGRSDEALPYLWKAFDVNRSSPYGYKKLAQVLYDTKRVQELITATTQFADYKINLGDPQVQRIMSIIGSGGRMPGAGTGGR